MVSSTRPVIYYYYKRCYFRLPRTRARGWEFTLRGFVLMRIGAAFEGDRCSVSSNPFIKSVWQLLKTNSRNEN